MNQKKLTVKILQFIGIREKRLSGHYYSRVAGQRVRNKKYKYAYKHKSFYWILKLIESVKNPVQLETCQKLIELYESKTKEGVSHLVDAINRKINYFENLGKGRIPVSDAIDNSH